MTAIVLNTLTAAVTEYGWQFQSITPTRATSASGLLTLGGDTDGGAPIAAELRGGTPGGDRVQSIDAVFLALRSPGTGTLIVQGRSQSWEYSLTARDSGVSVAKPGAGIKESYLGFGYKNTAGADFNIDRIDADVKSAPTRRK